MLDSQELHKTALSARRGVVCGASAVLGAMFALGAGVRLSMQAADAVPYPALVLALACFVNALHVLRTAAVDTAGQLLVGIVLVGMLITAMSFGGIGAPSIVLAPLIPAIAILSAGTRVAWVWLALAELVLVAIFALGRYGWVHSAGVAGLQTAQLLAAMVSTGLVAWISIRIAVLAEGLLRESWKRANIDYLTGVATRRALESALAREVGSAIRHGQWLTLAMADVDHFKRFNDRNGHQAGDACLVQVAEALVECASRPLDLVGRYGGEEFIVLLPGTDPDGARVVGEHMQAALARRAIPVARGARDCVTMTIGVVSVHGSAIDSIQALIGLADEALYAGKAAGRNRVVFRVVPPRSGGSLRAAG